MSDLLDDKRLDSGEPDLWKLSIKPTRMTCSDTAFAKTKTIKKFITCNYRISNILITIENLTWYQINLGEKKKPSNIKLLYYSMYTIKLVCFKK